MSAPADLRVKEVVIEEFGLSPKYSILLAIVGGLLVAAAVFFRVIRPGFFDAVGTQLGDAGPYLVGALTIAVLLVAAYLFGLAVFFRFAYRYYLTTERVISEIGFFSKRIVSAEYKTISDLIVRQDVIGQFLLDTGTLGVNTFGGQPEEVELANIDDPVARREQLRGLAEAVQHGHEVTPNLLQRLKSEKGMLASNEPAADGTEPQATAQPAPVTPDPVERELLSEANTADEVQGDDIEESDRLRAAQRRLPDDE